MIKLFNNNFLKLTYEFLDELILYKTKAFWPYDRLETSIVENFLSKISLRLGFENFSFSDVYYLNNKDLHRKFEDYLNKLISNLDKKNIKFIFLIISLNLVILRDLRIGFQISKVLL